MSAPVDLRTQVGVCPTERAVLAATGPDSETFLQGQLSQDMVALAPGRSAWSLILQPQGRIDAFVRVTRRTAERFVLDTDGSLEQVVARLRRFMLRTDVTLEPLDWKCLAVRGPGAAEVQAAGEIVAPVPTGGIDVLGPAPEVSPAVPRVPPEVLEAHRISAGFPRMGVDIDDRTIPAEAEVVPWTVSFTKGCFTGQELVARMDSRGSSAPRYLRRLALDGRREVAAGDPVADTDGAEIGAVTSAAYDAVADATVALGYLKRSVTVPAEVVVAGAPARATAVPRAQPPT
ncbi:YgfZ/GcvT domain-containing protein [Candidatus Poriferisocius sp.]|uniref:CAF17-like 4Fe-4S cluster assembly/insertion protein YgfZ n=1 Tax=Candidatus Poriferisocius sp. TaxID=3101276 RepID=UPI003B5CED32